MRVEVNEIAQALVGGAALLISLFTFVLASNDRRHREDREDNTELREANKLLREQRDDFERKYFLLLEENARLRRDRS